MTILVTGVGAVTAIGKTATETFDRLLEGERGFGELALFDAGDLRTRLVAEVRGLPPDAGASDARSRTSHLALLAAREAIAAASLDVSRRRVGLIVGGTTAGMFETESVLAALLSDATGVAAREAALAHMLSHPLSAPTDRLASELGPFVRTRSLSSACSSGANALAVGAAWLELGLVDAVLCGGADALCRVTLHGFNALAALDPSGARPFDKDRRGLTLGEGAGFVVLERRDPLRAEHRAGRGAVCTLLGWASRAEAHHITNPEASGEGPFRAIQAALARAGRSTSDIDYVNAHGTGTPLNDAMESRVLARLFAEDVGRVRVSSQKGMIGHTLAAAGAIEAVITALAIERGVAPPTGGLVEPDPECALRHVLRAERCSIRTAITSSFGFGGMDTALVLGPASAAAPARGRPRGVLVTGVSVVTPTGVVVGEAVADVPERPAASMEITIADDALDPERARRLDRASRLAAIACGHALGARDVTARREAGVVLGISFGAVDGCAEFMRRLQEKGARMVRPADFPGLVPSSPAGHVSIYLGLTGPTLVVADLAASGEAAVIQAAELVAAGDAECLVAGAVEERSPIVEQVLSVVFSDDRGPAPVSPRGEGAAAIALAADGDATGPALARIAETFAWLDRGPALPVELEALSPPPDGAVVVLGASTRRTTELVDGSAWRTMPRIACAPTCGGHEAAGGIAIAVACAKVARGDAKAALFVGSARGSGYAGTVWPVERRP